MAKSKRKRVPKTVFQLPGLEQSKSAVLNSLTSVSANLHWLGSFPGSNPVE